jgi:hypothetical protein
MATTSMPSHILMDSSYYHQLCTMTQARQMEEKPARWYWKLVAISSSWSLLIGFLVFTMALGDPHPSESNKLVAAGSVTIAVAYTVSIALCFWGRQGFLLDCVFIPFLGSSLIALANVVFNITYKSIVPLTAPGAAIISLSAISTVIYGIASMVTGFQVNTRNELIRRQRHHGWPDDGNPLLTDDEQQRLQLLKLLQRKADTAPSPEALQGTFRIDLPDNMSPQNRDRGRYLFTPGLGQDLPAVFAAAASTYGAPTPWEPPEPRPAVARRSPDPSPQSRERRRVEIEHTAAAYPS